MPTETASSPPFEVMDMVALYEPDGKSLLSTVAVMVSTSVVVSPLAGETVSHSASSIMLQVRVPPPIFSMVKVLVISTLPKSKLVGSTFNCGGGSISVMMKSLLSSQMEPSARLVILTR